MIAPEETAVALAVELRGVSVHHGAKALLDGVDLTVESGRSCGIVGANGSGKSALLRVVAGLCRPSGGEVRVDGVPVLDRPARVRRAIGYAGDADGLAERMTALEHLEMVAAQRGIGRADRREAAWSMLELVDLSARARLPVASLSRGQRRRLALALALVHDPPIVLLDEPMSGIDETGRGELVSILLELRAMGKTLLIASQAPSEVAEVCDQVVSLVDGHLEASGERGSEPATLTWVELAGEVEPALRALREYPGVEDLAEEGGFVTFRGPKTAEERARVVDWLVGNGIRLAGFGTTTSPVGGGRG